MKKQFPVSIAWLAGFWFVFASFLPQNLAGQCMTYPVSLDQRVQNAEFICLGKVKTSEAFEAAGKIFTLHTVEVSAWLKGHRSATEIGVLTLGGWLVDRGMTAHPSLKLNGYDEFMLFLEADNLEIDHQTTRLKKPEMIQARAYSESQGALKYQFGFYHDLHFPKKTELEKFAEISNLTGQPILKPDGQAFAARNYTPPATAEVATITSFSPNPTNGGTIVPAQFLTIIGTGFGASPGTVWFTNADDGGATFMNSGVASDYTAWSNTSITVKVADGAGTGHIMVNADESTTNLTVNYDHLAISDIFHLWPVITRQRYYHRNLNGLGGYTFRYNSTLPTGPTSMANHTTAKAAFERALITWRCSTAINFIVNGTTTVGGVADDGTNVVFFNPGADPGTLGVAYSFFSGSGNASCNMANTVWWQTGVDIEYSDPPAPGYTWNFGPGAPSGSQYDFESVNAHELGHAGGLGHRIADGDLMHYAIANGSMNRYPNTHEDAGGTARVTYSSAATCFNPPGSGSPMVVVPAGSCSAAVLPIELLRFWLEGQQNLVKINWTTASETNNDRFDIERSTDGQTFFKLGQVPGHGNSSEEISYSFDDFNPPGGLFFYRLRQTDFDGKSSLSDIQTIRFQEKSGLSISPNPASDVLFISGKTAADLQVFNALGQLVRTHFHENGQSKIDLAGLAKGLYLLVDLTTGERLEFFVE